MNNPVYLGMSILAWLEFWYDYIKPIYQDRAKLCYMDTGRFIIYIKTDDFSKGIACDGESGLTHQTTMKMIKDHFQ